MEIASAYIALLPSAKGFGPAAERQITPQMATAGKRSGGKFGKVFASSTLGPMRTLGAAAAGVFAGVQVASFFKDAITGASDLQESTTKIEAIFGGASGAVQKFASQGAKALGQTKLEVLNASATFGTFGKAAGLAGGDLAKFSTGFAGLSTDLASFYNTSPTEAVEAIGAALRGEAEPIRKYGVLLNDATLRQEALRLGLIKSTKEALTPQQKVLAAQAAIYKQTRDAQGDFQRTSGGLANQQRILSAQWSDMRTRIGSALLPTVTVFVSYLNERLIPAIQRVSDWAIANLGPALQRVGDYIRTDVVPAAQDFAKWFGDKIAPILADIYETRIRQLVDGFKSLKDSVKRNEGDLRTFGTWLKRTAEVMAQVLGPAIKFLSGVQVKSLVTQVKIAIGVVTGFVRAVQAIGSTVRTAAGKVADLAAAFVEAARAVGEKISKVVEKARALPGRIKTALGDVGTLLYESGRKLIQGLIDGIEDKVKDLRGAIGKVAGVVGDHFPFSPVKTGPLTKWNNGAPGKNLMGMLARGIEAGGPVVARALGKALEHLQDQLKRQRGNLRSILDGLKSDFASLRDSVASAFTGDLFGVSASDAVTDEAGKITQAAASAGQNFISNLLAKKGELTNLLSAFKTLKGWGMKPEFLSQLFASGNGGIAIDLAAMGKTGALETGSLFGEVTSLGQQLGTAVGKNDPISAEIQKTNKKLDKVVAALEAGPDRTGDAVGRALNGAAGSAMRGRSGKRIQVRTVLVQVP